MSRLLLPVGTHGRIRVYRLGPKRFRARTQFRDHDGVVREVERLRASVVGCGGRVRARGAGLAEAGQQIKIKHSRHSKLRLAEARDALTVSVVAP